MFEIAKNEIADEIRKRIEALIAQFADEAKHGVEASFHEILTVNCRQNVRSFSNERLAELAGYVNEEVARRAQ